MKTLIKTLLLCSALLLGATVGQAATPVGTQVLAKGQAQGGQRSDLYLG